MKIIQKTSNQITSAHKSHEMLEYFDSILLFSLVLLDVGMGAPSMCHLANLRPNFVILDTFDALSPCDFDVFRCKQIIKP